MRETQTPLLVASTFMPTLSRDDTKEASIDRMDRRCDRAAVELPRRHGRGDHALSRRQYRSGDAGDSALGYRLSLRVAGRHFAARQMARAAGLAGGSRARLRLLRRLLRALQHRAVLYDRRTGLARARHAAALDHGGRSRAARGGT